MNRAEYRAAIAALGLSQVGAAVAIGVTERTSRRYAAHGVPEKHSAWVREKLAAFAIKEQSKGETDD
jgi:hypothetical protein